MLSTRVIPCLDVHNGRTVKGVNFNDLADAGNPVKLAQLYNKLGADELCFLDISATIEQRKTIYDMVSEVSEQCFIPLTVGGGVKEVLDFKFLLQSPTKYVISSGYCLFLLLAFAYLTLAPPTPSIFVL